MARKKHKFSGGRKKRSQLLLQSINKGNRIREKSENISDNLYMEEKQLMMNKISEQIDAGLTKSYKANTWSRKSRQNRSKIY